jgi:glycosyltransferase involved in cell wall biosynthesis
MEGSPSSSTVLPGVSKVSGSSGKRPMRAAFYMNNFDGGGVERQQIKLCGWLREHGVEVTLLLHSDSGPLRSLVPDDLAVIVFGTSRTLADVVPLSRYLRQAKPDVLVSSIDHQNVAALLARWLAGGTTRVYPCQHNALSPRVAAALGWKYHLIPACYRLFAGVATHFIAVSAGVAQDVVKRCGINRNRVFVVYNPVIDEEFQRLATDSVEHPWFQTRADPVFVTAGRLTLQKDHATLLRAFALLLEKRVARLMILGTGPLRPELERLAAELGISSAVQFLGFQRNPLPYFREADAFVLPSLFEGFGNVLVEAMGCGTPVIAADCPHGPSEILAGGKFGVLVPPGDSKALAEVLVSEKWRKWTPDQLRQRADMFTVDAAAKRYLDILTGAGSTQP